MEAIEFEITIINESKGNYYYTYKIDDKWIATQIFEGGVQVHLTAMTADKRKTMFGTWLLEKLISQ